MTMKCPKCDSVMVKAGKQRTRQGIKQRYQCRKGHIITRQQ